MARASPVKRSPESSRRRTLTTSPGVTSLPGRRAVVRSDLSADRDDSVAGHPRCDATARDLSIAALAALLR